MSTKQPASAPAPDTAARIELSDQSFQLLMKEYETVRDLFIQTEKGVQGIFNFYFTMVTTVVGGIILILQLAPLASDIPERSQLIICLLLFLAAIIGTVYLLSLAGRYAHLVRYGRNLDAIRLFLLRELDTPAPAVYDQFLGEGSSVQSRLYSERPFTWLAWLLPTGTYQLAMSFINSLAFAVATWLLLSASEVASVRVGQNLLVVVIELLLIFTIYNVYSRLAIRRWLSDFGVHINPQFDHPFRMIR